MPRTPGPWRVHRDRTFTDRGASINRVSDPSIGALDLIGDSMRPDDAAFIVLACNAHDALTAENAALREALRACVTDEGAHCYQTGSVHAFDCRIKGINAEARAALAIADGADGRCKECGEHLDDGHGPHCDTGGNL